MWIEVGVVAYGKCGGEECEDLETRDGGVQNADFRGRRGAVQEDDKVDGMDQGEGVHDG